MMLLYALFLSVLSVDRGKFRTCEQGSFCRRYRKWVERQRSSPVQWDIVTDISRQSFQLKNANDDAQLTARLDFYACGAIRLRINETNPLHRRYTIPEGDVIENAPTISPKASTLSNGGVSYQWLASDKSAQFRVDITRSPFRLELYVDGRLSQTINGQGFFNFEVYRKKTIKDRAIDAANHPEVDENGLWEEGFSSFTDKKPYGPAAIGVDVAFAEATQGLYGLPEHATGLKLKSYDEPYRLFNLDVFEYELDEPMALYGAIPILWAPGKNSTTAFLSVNPSETFVKVQPSTESGTETWFTSESGVMDMILFPGPTPTAVSAQYHIMTGPPQLPPIFSLGLHQCRWNYKDEKDLLGINAKYEEFDIPMDALWLDIEHTDSKRYFTWTKDHFPDPAGMRNKLAGNHRQLVTIVDPHIKKDTSGGYAEYNKIGAADQFCKIRNWEMIDDPNDTKPADHQDEIDDPNANVEEGAEKPKIANPWKPKQILNLNSSLSVYDGYCWPGTSNYPDFTSPDMRALWASFFKEYLAPGEDSMLSAVLPWYKEDKAIAENLYTWNDMNEPSVFNGPEVSMPRDAVCGEVEHRDTHNLYGMYVHRATYEGHLLRNPQRRPFVLTRSFFIGSHKTTAVWTGDNFARWDHLSVSVPMCLSLALGGISFVGADVGGFFGHPDEELSVRWHQFGALAYPFYRSHAHIESPRREPWTYSTTGRNRIRDAIMTRYKLLPYYYTTFRRYETTGEMIIQPTWYAFPSDARAHDNEVLDTQILVGHDLLVRVVDKPFAEMSSVNVYLPSNTPSTSWYDYYTHTVYPAGTHKIDLSEDHVPVFARGGSIIPQKWRLRRSATAMKRDPFTLQVFLNQGKAAGSLYVDDGTTLAYREGDYVALEMRFENDSLIGVPTVPRNAPSLGDGLVVERIVVSGILAAKIPKAVRNKDKALDWSLSPLINSHGLYEVVVKLPGIDVSKPFQIDFSQKASDEL